MQMIICVSINFVSQIFSGYCVCDSIQLLKFNVEDKSIFSFSSFESNLFFSEFFFSSSCTVLASAGGILFVECGI